MTHYSDPAADPVPSCAPATWAPTPPDVYLYDLGNGRRAALCMACARAATTMMVKPLDDGVCEWCGEGEVALQRRLL